MLKILIFVDIYQELYFFVIKTYTRMPFVPFCSHLGLSDKQAFLFNPGTIKDISEAKIKSIYCVLVDALKNYSDF